MRPRYFIWDTETTGAGTSDAIVEVACVEVDDEMNEIGRMHSLIDPQRPISASASGVHGITIGMCQDKPTIAEWMQIAAGQAPAWGHYNAPPLGGDMVFIAHKAAFDRRYLNTPLAEVGVNIVGQMCTLLLARRYLVNAENHKLSTLMYQYGLAMGTSHRADGDVDTTVSLIKFVQSLCGKSLTQLISEDGMPQLRTAPLGFGKYKDIPMMQLDRGYAQWCLKNLTELDIDTAFTLRARAEGRI